MKWRQLDDTYMISENGDVKNIKRNKLLKPYGTGRNRNYLCVKLDGINYKVHRLVAEVFIPNPDDKPEVNHIDGNPLNNSISNLEWVTKSENMVHAHAMGLLDTKDHCRENGKKVSKKVNQYDLQGEIINSFNSIRNASKELNIQSSTISNQCRNLLQPRKNKFNFYFRFAEKEEI